MGVQDAGKCVEIYYVRDEAESKKKMKRRLRRHREKARLKENAVAAPQEGAGAWSTLSTADDIKEGKEEEASERPEGLVASDELEYVAALRVGTRVRGFSFTKDLSGEDESLVCRLVLALHNNSLEVHSVTTGGEEKGVSHKLLVVDGLGHRSDVRALSLSSDDSMLASTCTSVLKVWNTRTQHCVRTSQVGSGLCVAFGPADQHVIVGTKEGKLVLVELASGDIIESHDDAHTGAIWSIDIRPDGKGLATGGADHDVKFWDFELVEGRLSLVHSRTLKMADDVLAVRFSHTKDPSKLLIAVALLDSTVKVFHDDSLRFFLSLYGHKLPVLSMDISDDGEIIATASADKTIKIWGLDFGDCHRSLLAHGDSVMGLRFVPNTHYLFSCSKDRVIKYWDADHFEQILSLPGHTSEVWGLAVASDGSFVVSCGHDRSLRVWDRTEDMVFLEEEREKELEAMFEAELDRPDKGQAIQGKAGGWMLGS